MSTGQTPHVSVIWQPTSATTCKFVVDEALGWPEPECFASKSDAEETPLAKHIFAFNGVSAVRIDQREVIVSKISGDDWSVLATQIEAVLREHVRVTAERLSKRISEAASRARAAEDSELTGLTYSSAFSCQSGD